MTTAVVHETNCYVIFWEAFASLNFAYYMRKLIADTAPVAGEQLKELQKKPVAGRQTKGA